MERGQSAHHPVRGGVEDSSRGFRPLKSHPELGYILPFVVFIGFLAIGRYVSLGQPLRFFAVLLTLVIFSRGLLPLRPSRFFSSVLLGIAVFFIWIGPDVLIPGYHNFILFSNSLVGLPEGTTIPAG